jgi:mono/diheme cytochrome c family protein
MKKILAAVAGLIFILSFTSSALAFGDWKKGKALFKTECTTCHKRGGDAQRLKFNKMTKKEWIAFCNTPDQGTHETLFNGLSAAQREHLLQYFLKYAKEDKPTQLSCAG